MRNTKSGSRVQRNLWELAWISMLIFWFWFLVFGLVCITPAGTSLQLIPLKGSITGRTSDQDLRVTLTPVLD